MKDSAVKQSLRLIEGRAGGSKDEFLDLSCERAFIEAIENAIQIHEGSAFRCTACETRTAVSLERLIARRLILKESPWALFDSLRHAPVVAVLRGRTELRGYCLKHSIQLVRDVPPTRRAVLRLVGKPEQAGVNRRETVACSGKEARRRKRDKASMVMTRRHFITGQEALDLLRREHLRFHDPAEVLVIVDPSRLGAIAAQVRRDDGVPLICGSCVADELKQIEFLLERGIVRADTPLIDLESLPVVVAAIGLRAGRGAFHGRCLAHFQEFADAHDLGKECLE